MVELTTHESLRFQQSHSQCAGFCGQALRQVKNNAGRVVGAGKVTADGLSIAANASYNVHATGAMDWQGMFFANPGVSMMSGGLLFSLLSRFILMLYGGQDNEKAKHHDPDSPLEKVPDNWQERISQGLGKAMRPSEYPIEAASAMAMLGGMTILAGAVVMPFFLGELSFATLLQPLSTAIIGAVVAATEANVLFGDKPCAHKQPVDAAEMEGNDLQSLIFADSKSQSVGVQGMWMQKMRENPEMTSGILQAVTGLAQVGLGASFLMQGATMAGMLGIGAGLLYIAANIVYSLFVRRDSEVTMDETPEVKPAEGRVAVRPSWVEKLQQQDRSPSASLGYAL